MVSTTGSRRNALATAWSGEKGSDSSAVYAGAQDDGSPSEDRDATANLPRQRCCWCGCWSLLLLSSSTTGGGEEKSDENGGGRREEGTSEAGYWGGGERSRSGTKVSLSESVSLGASSWTLCLRTWAMSVEDADGPVCGCFEADNVTVLRVAFGGVVSSGRAWEGVSDCHGLKIDGATSKLNGGCDR